MAVTVKLPETTTQAVMARLRRIEGQVRGLNDMLAARRDCIDIVQQLSAVRGALDRAAVDIISAGMEQCLRMELRGDTRAGSALRKARKAFLMLR
ncbi:MAG TPA: metal-sensitive transcriptional regulator [bacterium]|jgi:DNA-binding FrmR family transcriptional regulator|nr:metal-sensitive transcriptional regulator [bacterium]